MPLTSERQPFIEEQMEEMRKGLFRDRSRPINWDKVGPPRFPDPANSTTEEQIEWMRSEYERVNSRIENYEEDLRRFKEKVDIDCGSGRETHVLVGVERT